MLVTDYVKNTSGPDPGAIPSNVELFSKVGTQAHEFRFYNDITVNWEAILDIASTAHEYNMARFHRPGSWAFMDMLEVGVDFRGVPQTNGAHLTFAESRSHLALWVIMAQPLHLGLDIRNISTELLDLIGNEELLSLHADPLGAMGWRASMSDGRANGTQVWARALSDGSRLIGLLNAGWGAGNWSQVADNCTWKVQHGGFFQGKAGNYACWPKATGACTKLVVSVVQNCALRLSLPPRPYSLPICSVGRLNLTVMRL